MMVRTKHNGYAADGRRLYFKGGGDGGDTKYANLEGLYAEQAASARLLRGMAEQNLPAVTNAYVGEVNEVLDSGYAEKQADLAAGDMATANAMEREATARELSSMGVNPNDARFSGGLKETELQNSARMAAGKNAARRDADNKQLAVAQDAVGTFTGQSNSAASQLANTSSGMANMIGAQNSQQMARQNQQSQNTSNAVAGGMMAMTYFKDGGKVRKPGGIKRLEKHAGFLGGSGQVGSQQGFTSFEAPQPPPSMQQQQPQSQSNTMLQGGMKAKKLRDAFTPEAAASRTEKIGNVVGKFSESGGNQIGSRAAGMRMNGTQAESAAKAYEAAAGEAGDAAAKEAYLDSAANIRAGAGLDGTATAGGAQTAGAETAGAIGTEAAGAEAAGAAGAEVAGAEAAGAAATEAAGTAAAEVAGTAAAETAGAAAAEAAAAAAAETAATAATTTAASSVGTAAAAVGTAMPWVGAAMAVGSLLGAFNEGGKVESIPMLAGGGGVGGIDFQELGDYSHLGAGGLTNWLQGKEKPDENNKEKLLSMSGDVIGMKLFNEGGDVEGKPVQDKREGGEVDGKWEGNTDTVPALLTEDEHVVNAETAALIGHDALDDANKQGLALREKGWTPPKIRAAGLGLKKGVA